MTSSRQNIGVSAHSSLVMPFYLGLMRLCMNMTYQLIMNYSCIVIDMSLLLSLLCIITVLL